MTIKAVGIRELKTHLSMYLREVQTGSRLLVLEHKKVIAAICQPTIDLPLTQVPSLVDEWVQTSQLHRPIAKRKKCPKSPLKFPAHTSHHLIHEDRGE